MPTPPMARADGSCPLASQDHSSEQVISERRPGLIAARIDRLPVGWSQWRLVMLVQLFWGVVICLDPLVLRIYPTVWEPQHAFGPAQYELLVGFSNGLGPLVGDYLFGFFSDRFGRRPTMIAGCLIAGLLYIPVGFTSNWVVLLTTVSFASLGIGAALAAAPAYNTEISPPHARGRLLLGGQVVAWTVLGVLASIPAIYLLPDHLPSFVLLFALFPVVVMVPLILAFIPESPRWLEGKGRYEKADRIVAKMERAAERKHGPLPEPDTSGYGVQVTEKVPIGEVFRGAYLGRTLILLFVWILIYAGVDYGYQSYLSVYLVDQGWSAHDLFLILTIGGIGGVAMIVVGAVLNERIERKTLVFVCGVFMCIGGAMIFADPHSFTVLVIAAAILSAGLFGFLCNMYNYTATAYPTRLRAVGVGWTDGVGHVGAIAGPFIAGAFYAATADQRGYGWILWFALAGSLLPGLIMLLFGIRQRRAPLEQLSG